MPHDHDLLPFDLKINGFPGLMVDHVYVKFGDSTLVFETSCGKTKRHINATENPTHATTNIIKLYKT